MKSENSLLIKNICKSYPQFELKADFSVSPGERVAIMAPSGSGKTTLFRLIAGLEPLHAGEGQVFRGDQELTLIPAEKREVGVVFQEWALFPHLSVIENIAYPLKIRGIEKEMREAQAMEWLKKLSMGQKAKQSIQKLSGGQKQRVAFARALIWKPKTILLDEPFSALDAATRGSARSLLLDLHGEVQVPLVLVTHDSADASQVATRVLKYQSTEDGLKHYFSE